MQAIKTTSTVRTFFLEGENEGKMAEHVIKGKTERKVMEHAQPSLSLRHSTDTTASTVQTSSTQHNPNTQAGGKHSKAQLTSCQPAQAIGPKCS